jgi:hypothetical protein
VRQHPIRKPGQWIGTERLSEFNADCRTSVKRCREINYIIWKRKGCRNPGKIRSHGKAKHLFAQISMDDALKFSKAKVFKGNKQESDK